MITLDLSHCNLIRLENLERLKNLRIGIFSNNEIKKIENLEQNTRLGKSFFKSFICFRGAKPGVKLHKSN